MVKDYYACRAYGHGAGDKLWRSADQLNLQSSLADAEISEQGGRLLWNAVLVIYLPLDVVNFERTER